MIMMLINDVTYFGNDGQCRMCYTQKYCTLYKCYDRCCDGYTRDIYGRCSNFSSGAVQCENGGKPYGIDCQCPQGFIGQSCEIPVCNCMNGGKCTVRDGQPFCNCTEGHYGDQCELSTCRTCLNGGTCLRDDRREYCVCTPEYVGDSCEKRFNQPGTCPSYNGTQPYCCGEECYSNSDCSGDQVCCKEGCKTVCRKPVATCTANDGTRLMAGQIYKPDSCTDCYCQPDGDLPCRSMSCAPPPCGQDSRVTMQGECCASCGDTARPPRIICPSNTVILNTSSGSTETFTVSNTRVSASYGYDREPIVTFSPELIRHCACSDPLSRTIKVKASVQGLTGIAECTFEAVLRDTIAPVFKTCPKDIYVMDYEVPKWSDPVYSDNVGVFQKECPDARYRQPLAAGNYSLSYVVLDYEMNEGRCDFNVYVSSPNTPVEQLPQGQRERLSRTPGNDVFQIVGVSIGAIVLVAVILVVVFVCKRRQRLNNPQSDANARRRPRDLRTGFSHGIYAIPGDLDVKLPPYTPSKSPPPYDNPDYIKADIVDGKDYLSQPPPYYINPGYETMSSVRKESVGDENVSVKSDKVKSEKADK
ncbi:hypothetical protein DPMN_053468 [Dreissena polymorpha]|uniref:Uncharacterized protein n=1 Tax=Dreissena polymorpha TaxID=45954 RepID=A0A9D4CMU6_DREPO|nr:hypothetical protein DPMN_053468 [Dreissena polymorpha]